MTSDTTTAHPAGVTAAIATADLDRLLATEIISRLANAAASSATSETTRVAIAAMATTAAALTGHERFAGVTGAVLNAAAAYIAAAGRASGAQVFHALGAVDAAAAVRFCTDVKDLAVSDWIAARAAAQVRALLPSQD